MIITVIMVRMIIGNSNGKKNIRIVMVENMNTIM